MTAGSSSVIGRMPGGNSSVRSSGQAMRWVPAARAAWAPVGLSSIGTVRFARVRVCGRVSGMSTTPNPYRGFRFPAEIINQAVWLYHCFSLSLREVELILAARILVVSYGPSASGACASDGPTLRPSKAAATAR